MSACPPNGTQTGLAGLLVLYHAHARAPYCGDMDAQEHKEQFHA